MIAEVKNQVKSNTKHTIQKLIQLWKEETPILKEFLKILRTFLKIYQFKNSNLQNQMENLLPTKKLN